MLTEIFYIGHDNTIDLLLKANGSAVDLSSVTKMELEIKDIVTISTASYPGVIKWAGGLETGRIAIDLNEYNGNLPVGRYVTRLIVYSPAHPRGIVWGEFILQISN